MEVSPSAPGQGYLPADSRNIECPFLFDPPRKEGGKELRKRALVGRRLRPKVPLSRWSPGAVCRDPSMAAS